MRKKLQVVHKKIVNPLSEREKGIWYDYLVSEPNEDVMRKKGSVYGLVSVKGRWGIKGDELLKKFLNNFNNFYYQNPETQVIKNLEQAVKFAHKKLVSELSDEDSSNTFFNFIVFILWGNVLYIAQAGKAKAILIREEEVESIGSQLVENLKEELFANTIHIASGLIKKNDVVVLGMPLFWKHVNTNKLKLWLQNTPIENIDKKIQKAYSDKNISQALLLKFSVGIYPSEEEVINISIPAYEEKNKFIEKSRDFFSQIIGKLKNIFSQKPLTVLVKKRIVQEERKLSKNEFKDTIEKSKPKKNINEFPQDAVSQPFKSLRPQEPNKLWEFIQKNTRKFTTWFNLLRQQLNMARQQSAKQKETQASSDPDVYLKRKWWTQLFVRRGWMLVLGLAVLLVVSVSLTNYLKNSNSKQSGNEIVYNEIVSEIDEAKRISFSLTQRQEVFQKGSGVLEQLKSTEFDREKIIILKSKLQELRDEIYNVSRIDDSKIVADISLKRDNAKPNEIALISDVLYVLDSDNKFLYSTTISGNDVTIVSLEEDDTNWKLLLGGSEELYGYSDDRIAKYNVQLSIFDNTIDKDEEWKNVLDIGEYYGNIYLLDSKSRQVWKYAGAGSGFSNKIAYITQTPDVGFEDAVSLTIDGSIYVLLQDGQIWKFATGTRQEFSIKGLDISFNEPTQIYSHEEFKYLYILDKGNKRIVLLDKQGQYQKQYTSENWNDLKSFVVGGKEKKMYVLNGAQILEIDLGKSDS